MFIRYKESSIARRKETLILCNKSSVEIMGVKRVSGDFFTISFSSRVLDLFDDWSFFIIWEIYARLGR